VRVLQRAGHAGLQHRDDAVPPKPPSHLKRPMMSPRSLLVATGQPAFSS
jgi:hypothetical protein